MTDAPERWPRVDVRDPGVPERDQDRTVYPVPEPPTAPWHTIFLDLVAARDRRYNR